MGTYLPSMDDKQWWQSSAHDGVSATLKGILISFIPLVIFLAKQKNIDLTPEAVSQILDQVVTFIGLGVTIFGIARKIYFRFKK